MVHATFQPGGTIGKIGRFRENNMWKLDPRPLTSQKYVTYSNNVEVSVDSHSRLTAPGFSNIGDLTRRNTADECQTQHPISHDGSVVFMGSAGLSDSLMCARPYAAVAARGLILVTQF